MTYEVPSIDALKIGIKAIKEQDKKERRWEKTFDEMLDGRFICCTSQTLNTALLKVLEIMYRDEEEQIISWWIYETDCGKRKDFHIYDGGGVIPTDTVEDLYNYLIKYHFKDTADKTLTDELAEYIKDSNSKKIEVTIENTDADLPPKIIC